MPDNIYNWNYRLSISEASIPYGALLAQGIPPPTTPLYSEFSQSVNTADGAQANHGNISVTWQWDELDFQQYRRLRTIIDYCRSTSGDGYIYFTADKGVSGTGRGSWIDAKGRPLVPVFQTAPNTDGLLANDFVLRINNVEIINDPANNLP